MEVANTLAYYDTATIKAVKSFIVQAPGSLKGARTLSLMALSTQGLHDDWCYTESHQC
jgi:hypothetical protein